MNRFYLGPGDYNVIVTKLLVIHLLYLCTKICFVLKYRCWFSRNCLSLDGRFNFKF